jgi:hypothetical protein
MLMQMLSCLNFTLWYIDLGCFLKKFHPQDLLGQARKRSVFTLVGFCMIKYSWLLHQFRFL